MAVQSSNATVEPKLKVYGRLVRRKPGILVVPVVSLALMLGLGVWGVLRAMRMEANQARAAAELEAESIAKTLQLATQQATLPLYQMGAQIKIDTRLSRWRNDWQDLAPSWFQAAPAGCARIAMIPAGIVALEYPTPALGDRPFNLLTEPSFAAPTIRAIQMNAPAITGPYISAHDGIFTLAIQKPVYVKADTYSSWGFGDNPECPPGLCTNITSTHTRYWGSVGIMLDFPVFLQSIAPVQALANKGYKYELYRDGVEEGMIHLRREDGAVPKDDAVLVRFEVADGEWMLYMWKELWVPSYIQPLVAVVVVGATIISILILCILLSWEEHRALLHSLLPKATLQRMRAAADWAKTNKNEHHLTTINLETPAQNMLSIIRACLEAREPSVALLLAVQDALQRSADVYRPTAESMQERMQESEFVDAEVRKALVAQLVGQSGVRAEDDTACDTTDTEPRHSAPMRAMLLVKAATFKQPAVPGPGGDGTGPNLAKPSSPKARAALDVDINRSSRPCIATCEYNPEWSTHVRSTMLKLMELNAQNVQQWQSLGAVATGQQLNAVYEQCEVASEESVGQQAGGAAELICISPHWPIMSQLEQGLASANQWVFDAYAFEEATNDRPLSVLGFWLLHSTGLINWARMDAGKLVAFLQCVEAGYPDNPYHNRRHAADVLQSLHVIIHRGGLRPGYVDNSTLLACYLAAIIHDFEHRGRTNDYLVNSHDDLAVRYNDRSPMENHHLAAAFALLKTPQYNCLAGLSKSTWLKVRKLVIELVLATDMKQHFAILGQFDTLHQFGAQNNSLNNSPSSELAEAINSRTETTDTDLAPVSENDRTLSLQMALKCADLGHLTAPTKTHERWVRSLEQEFFLQGDAERAQGLPISPLCDRTKEGVTKSQIGFFDFVVIPCFRSFTNRFSSSRPLFKAIKSNYRHWSMLAVKQSAETRPSSQQPGTAVVMDSTQDPSPV